MTLVEEIHKAVDEASSVLVKMASDKVSQLDSQINSISESERAKILKGLGFISTKEVVALNHGTDLKRQLQSDKSNTSRVINDIEKYSKLFPFNKFIYLSQIINILEKYNLYMGHSSLYRGNVPDKNLIEIKSFERFTNDVPARKSCRATVSYSHPLFATSAYGNSGFNFYIFAPKKEFNLEGCQIIGKEIFKSGDWKSKIMFDIRTEYDLRRQKDEDPVVLMPVITSLSQIGFIVVSKWGDEANIPEVANVLDN